MILSFSMCLILLLTLIRHSRSVGLTLGLPVAYLFCMLFQHLPGAVAHIVGRDAFIDSSATAIGLRFTAIGTLCFVAGVLLAHSFARREIVPESQWSHDKQSSQFAVYCLMGGWSLVVVAVLLGRIPSLGAAMSQAAAVWMLGVIVGLSSAYRERRFRHFALWLAALSLYPLYVLIRAGFLSFGSTSVFLAFSNILVIMRGQVRSYAAAILFSVVCFLLFLSYFQNRDDIREATWGNAPWETRVKRAAAIITDFGWFDPDNPKQLAALDERLNQGKFAGLSAQRIESGQVDFLHGRSVREGLLALVPRALWEGKPVFAGSSVLIREMTGLEVNENTTFGVGQVMEFYINFGIPSLVLGFIVFGFAYGWIDWKVAEALQRKDFDRALFWFLPGAAMLAPLASIAETMGNLAAALVAALGLRYAWSVLWRVRSERVAVQLHAQDPKQTDTSQTSNSDGQLQATRP